MSRLIVIDEDTSIGYSYLNKNFYITNKSTTTYRTTPLKAKEVLDIVAPANQVTLQDLVTLRDTYELVGEGDEDIHYTWEDTGAYIKTIQLHDYKDYPLFLDAEEGKLTILNSNVVFDLSLNESKQTRIDYLISFYKNTLGIQVSPDVMGMLYDLIYSFYIPCVYNIIAERDEVTSPLMYSNTFTLSNYSKTSKATYTGVLNPTESFTGSTVANILYINPNTKSFILTSTPSSLYVGQKILIEGTSQDINGTTYTDDGTYTIQSISGTEITTEEQPVIEFSPNYTDCYLKSSIVEVQTVYRDTSIINLTTIVPNTIKVGDVITIEGTGYTSNDQTITADGDYTVAAINGSNITVQETPQINYNYTEGIRPTAYKKYNIGTVQQVDSTSKTITLLSDMSSTLSTSSLILINNIQYTVTSSILNTITVSEDIPDYTIPYAYLQERVPMEIINLTTISTTNEENFPKGEFILDTFNQCVAYIQTLEGLTYPNQVIRDNMYQPLPLSLTLTNCKMSLLGIYSEVYPKS